MADSWRATPRVEYDITLTTWDHGNGHSEAMPEGRVRDHLLGLGQQALGLFPDITQVVFKCGNTNQITVYRKEANDG
jgi:hypothetical protein